MIPIAASCFTRVFLWITSIMIVVTTAAPNAPANMTIGERTPCPTSASPPRFAKMNATASPGSTL